MVIEKIMKRIEHIPSTVWEPEVRLWDKYLKNKEGVLLDVGTGWGKSAAALGLIAPKLSIQTIDIGTEYANHTRTMKEYVQEVQNNLRRAGVSNVYFKNVAYQEYTCPYTLQALNVDVTATYDDYLAVVGKFLPSVIRDGYVFIHSYVHPKEDGPRRVLNEHHETFGLQYLDIADVQMVGGRVLQPAVFKKVR